MAQVSEHLINRVVACQPIKTPVSRSGHLIVKNEFELFNGKGSPALLLQVIEQETETDGLICGIMQHHPQIPLSSPL